MPTLEFRTEKLTAKLLDPRRGFELTELELEVRWDPLTGQSARILSGAGQVVKVAI